MNAPASASELAASAAAGTKPSLVMSNYFAHEQMTGLVRKDLSLALRDLLQHGLTGALDGEGASGSASGAMEMARPSAASRAALIGSAALKLRPTTVGRVQRVAGSSGNSGASGAIGAAFSSNGYSCGASSSSSSSAVGLLSLGLGCFGASSSRAAGALLPSIAHQSVGKPVHAWEVVLLYYDHKVILSLQYGSTAVYLLSILSFSHFLLLHRSFGSKCAANQVQQQPLCGCASLPASHLISLLNSISSLFTAE